MVIVVKRIVLWFMSTLTVVTLLFGCHTSTSVEPATGGASVGAALATRTWPPQRSQVLRAASS
jgi:hypothetical protein